MSTVDLKLRVIKSLFNFPYLKRHHTIIAFIVTIIIPVYSSAQVDASFSQVDASFSQVDASFSQASGASAYSDEALLPEGILKLPSEEKYLIWIELGQGRLNLLEQQESGGLKLAKVIPVSIGKNGFGKRFEGDKRTPVGVYHFTRFIDDNELSDFYGLGAYPLNYPNVLDRRLSRTGSGIWLHGLPKGVNQRPFLDSDGCVVIDNTNLEKMSEYIDTGRTHIILTEADINWVPKGVAEAQSNALFHAFENWKEAWQSKDNDLYLSFYAKDFDNFSQNKQEWDSYKRQVNKAKSKIEVEVSQLSFVNGAEEGIVSVRYYQHYQSNNYNWDGWKEQLWERQGDLWKIIYEGHG